MFAAFELDSLNIDITLRNANFVCKTAFLNGFTNHWLKHFWRSICFLFCPFSFLSYFIYFFSKNCVCLYAYVISTRLWLLIETNNANKFIYQMGNESGLHTPWYSRETIPDTLKTFLTVQWDSDLVLYLQQKRWASYLPSIQWELVSWPKSGFSGHVETSILELFIPRGGGEFLFKQC